MRGGMAVNLVFFNFLKRPSPYFADSSALPSLAQLDTPLVVGSALFGIGWALEGLCPGPAIASLAYGSSEVIFFLALAFGLLIGSKVKDWFLTAVSRSIYSARKS